MITGIEHHEGEIRMLRGKNFLPILLGLSLVSCGPAIFFGAGAAAGIGAFKWYQGELAVLYKAPFIETWDGTLKALEGMQLKITKKTHDLTAGRIEAQRADKKDIIINLKYKSADETEVDIQVGLFGDQEASIAIKDAIRKEVFKK